MHTSVSGCGHFLVASDEEGIDLARRYLSYFPSNWTEQPPPAPPAQPAGDERDRRHRARPTRTSRSTSSELIDALIDEGSWLEVQPKWAPELVVGYARLDGRVVGIVANQPKVKGGVLFVDSADKAARFIWTCNAFNVPLLFLADVPGFMIGSKVEREGIIRARREDDLRGVGGDGPEDLRGGAQVLRRRALRDGRAGLRAGLLPRAADGADRRDGPGGGHQRRLLQPDPGDRGPGRARAVRAARSARSTRPTSTSCTSPRSWSSTP